MRYLDKEKILDGNIETTKNSYSFFMDNTKVFLNEFYRYKIEDFKNSIDTWIEINGKKVLYTTENIFYRFYDFKNKLLVFTSGRYLEIYSLSSDAKIIWEAKNFPKEKDFQFGNFWGYDFRGKLRDSGNLLIATDYFMGNHYELSRDDWPIMTGCFCVEIDIETGKQLRGFNVGLSIEETRRLDKIYNNGKNLKEEDRVHENKDFKVWIEAMEKAIKWEKKMKEEIKSLVV